MKKLVLACVLVLPALATAACGQKLATDTLKPAQKSTSESVASDSASAPYCGVNTKGANPHVPTQGAVMVGYARLYDSGTNPLPCWSWSSAVYRGAFRFELGPYMGKKILSAVLDIGFGQSQYSSGSTAGNTGLWVKSIGLATSQWWTKPSPYIVGSQSGLFPWQPIPGMPNFPYGLHPAASPDFPIRSNGYYNYQVEVSNVVRDWLDGKEPNLGFVLIGPNESTVSGSGDTALSSLATIGLDITYSVPK